MTKDLSEYSKPLKSNYGDGELSFDSALKYMRDGGNPYIQLAVDRLPNGIIEAWSIEHECDSETDDHSYECLLASEIPDRYRRIISMALLRTVVEYDVEEFLPNGVSPRMYAMFDSIFSHDIYKLFDIEISEQNFTKRRKLAKTFDLLEQQFNELQKELTTLDRFDNYRRNISAYFNADPGKALLAPFIPRNISQAKLQDLFSAVATYIKQASVMSASGYEVVSASLDEFDEHTASLSPQYGASFLISISSSLKELIDQDFAQNPLSQAPSIRVEELPKKYPLHQIGSEFSFAFTLRNDGPGIARAVEVSYITSAGFEAIDSEIIVGDFGPNEQMRISMPIKVHGQQNNRTQVPTITIQINWLRRDGTASDMTIDLALNGQEPGIDWSTLAARNPYSLDPVGNKNELVGREDQLNQLSSLLHGSTVGSAVVWGQRRVGKTSIAKTFQHTQDTDPDHSAHVIFLDVGDFIHPEPRVTVDNMAQAIVHQLIMNIPQARQLVEPTYNGALSAITQFLDLLARQPNAPKVMIILDEFDSLPYELFRRGGPDSIAFFSSLRAISNRINYGFILVGGENMRRIEDQSGERLNKFAWLELTHLDRKTDWNDFRQLVIRPTESLLDFTDAGIARIYHFTSGHPYYTTLLCQQIYSDAVKTRDASITELEVDNAVGTVVSQSNVPVFIHYWTDGILDIGERTEVVTLARKTVLLALAEALRTNQNTTNENLLSIAQKYGGDFEEFNSELNEFRTRQVFDQQDGNYNCHVRLFQQWLVSVGPARIVTTFANPDAVKLVMADDEAQRVDESEIVELVQSWPLYRGKEITSTEVVAWLTQFGEFRRQRAMFKLLQRVDFFRDARVRQHLSNAHKNFAQILQPTVIKAEERLRRDIVVSYLSGEGKSGAILAGLYKQENRLFHENVVPPSRLISFLQKNRNIQAVVFVDDFIGTGKSITSTFETTVIRSKLLKELAIGKVFVGIIAIAAVMKSTDAIETMLGTLDPPGKLYVGDLLNETDKAFTLDANWDSTEQRELAKSVAVEIGQKLDKRNPLGFGNSESLVVFEKSCPNNSLPILWNKAKDWIPLFERAL
jgi:hypothetical protein